MFKPIFRILAYKHQPYKPKFVQFRHLRAKQSEHQFEILNQDIDLAHDHEYSMV